MTPASARVSAGLIFVFTVACHPKREPPGTAESTSASKSPLVGAWCMQSQALSLGGERSVDGSKWTFNEDGTYDYAQKWHRQEGTWKLTGNSLEISEVGAHEVIELQRDRMVLKRGSYQFFGRDCGPKYAKAEQIAALVAAAGQGSVDKVGQALGSGADINGLDEIGLVNQTALMAAARENRAAVVELLLRRGARVDRTNAAGDTAMTIAERLGYRDTMTLLERFGARAAPRPENTRESQAEGEAAAQRLMQAGGLDQRGGSKTSVAQLPARRLPGEPAARAPANGRTALSPREKCMNDNFNDDEAFARCERMYPSPSSPDDRPPRSASRADTELADHFFDKMREQGREGTKQRMNEIEQRFPERPGMTDQEKEELARKRLEAFVGGQ